MIINTGQRTDIPAFYPKWLANRFDEGFVMVRNPYNPSMVSKFILAPSVVDVIGFCSKNPAPFFPYLDKVKDYGQFWYVTITAYGKDIEPNVPDKEQVIEGFKFLSSKVGIDSIGWRYDPILINDEYTIDKHLSVFEKIAGELNGYTKTAVISFIDIYEKVRRNFPEAREVTYEDKLLLGQEMIKIANKNGMILRPCAEGKFLGKYGADASGCMTISMYEKAIGRKLNAPNIKPARSECACYLGADIGAYDTCLHLCKYCYANNDNRQVLINNKDHDPNSPFLIGGPLPGDVIHEVKQRSWIEKQISMFD